MFFLVGATTPVSCVLSAVVPVSLKSVTNGRWHDTLASSTRAFP